MEQSIREAIGKPTGDIYRSDLLGLTELSASNQEILDLMGLNHCANLKNLNLGNNHISDIAPLSGLINLEYLDLDSNQITDISPLSEMINLEDLALQHNRITGIQTLVDNPGVDSGDEVNITCNSLDLSLGSEDMQSIEALQERGVLAYYEP